MIKNHQQFGGSFVAEEVSAAEVDAISTLKCDDFIDLVSSLSSKRHFGCGKSVFSIGVLEKGEL